ncbi:MAG: beta-ketoacyl-ACP synthase II [Anaerolineales bacterium]|nr:beta-ketoacyl-ACP synthase II [Anaerolineales bacterium]
MHNYQSILGEDCSTAKKYAKRSFLIWWVLKIRTYHRESKEDSVTTRRVVVTGMGCISPLGKDLETTWEAIIAGKSGVDYITQFDTSQFKTTFAAEVKDFDPKAILGHKLARRSDRFAQFALVSCGQAIEDSGLEITDDNRDRIGVIIGTGIGGINTILKGIDVYNDRGPRWVNPFMVPMMIPDIGPGQVAIEYGLRGPNMAIVTACASGSNSIGEAFEVIRREAADVVVTGGAEAAIVPVAFASFNVMDAISKRNDDPQAASRPFDRDRDGFVVGEGAAALVIEELDFAVARGANILAEIVGYGTTNDAFHITAPAINGAGAAACMQLALEDAAIVAEQIDYINAHGTSTPLNDPSETSAIKTTFGECAYDVPISSTKSMTGHMFGAAGAIEAVFCVMAMNESVIPPTINQENPDPECDLDYVPNQKRQAEIEYAMSNSFGFGGHNATLIFRRFNSNGTS